MKVIETGREREICFLMLAIFFSGQTNLHLHLYVSRAFIFSIISIASPSSCQRLDSHAPQRCERDVREMESVEMLKRRATRAARCNSCLEPPLFFVSIHVPTRIPSASAMAAPPLSSAAAVSLLRRLKESHDSRRVAVASREGQCCPVGVQQLPLVRRCPSSTATAFVGRVAPASPARIKWRTARWMTWRWSSGEGGRKKKRRSCEFDGGSKIVSIIVRFVFCFRRGGRGRRAIHLIIMAMAALINMRR